MIKVKSRVVNDCFKCCIASMLNLAYEQVPHFYQNQPLGGFATPELQATIREWFAVRELQYVELAYAAPPDGIRETFGGIYPRLTYLLAGLSQAGHPHAVVCRGARVIFDPFETVGFRGGVTETLPNGKTHVGLIVVAKPDMETVSSEGEKR